MFEALGRLRERGAALLIVEQYVHGTLEIADVVYMLRQGVITFGGPASSVAGDEIMRAYLAAGPS